jgi:hypothetical protein
MLNGDRFRAKITDARTVCLDKLPGQSLWDHMKQGTLNERMLESAGKEYRRAPSILAQWNLADRGRTPMPPCRT